MNDNQNFTPDYLMRTLLVSSVVFVIACCVYFTCWTNESKPVIKVEKAPFNTTNAGEKVGKNVGRFGYGFFKGLWKSRDNK